MRARFRFRLTSLVPSLSAAALSAGFATPSTAQGCIVSVPDESISIELAPGTNALVELYLASGENGETFCGAEVGVPLSAFPTARLALRPADVARSLHDFARASGARQCQIVVMYENDTGEALAEHELCLIEVFRFGERRHWSVEPETTCWAPVDGVEARPVVID